MFSSRFLIGVLAATLAGATTYNCATYSVPGSTAVVVDGINNSGVVVGAYALSGTTHGFVANPSSGSFQTLDYPGSVNTQLFAINNNGVVTGEYNAPNDTNPNLSPGWFTVDSTGMFTAITVPSPYVISQVYGINDNGAIALVVGTSTAFGSPQTFAILNPDGTLTSLPGLNTQSENRPGALNNSLQMMESDYTFGQTALVSASGNLTGIQAAPVAQRTYAFGLNNLGIVAGYFSSTEVGGEQPPFTGFTRDASGVYSQVYCPGIPYSAVSNTPLWQAINDNGILAGNFAPSPSPSSPAYSVATPLPGQAQVNLSSTTLTFPPTPVGQTAPPQTVTLTNTGNARLDIAGFLVPGAFRASGCLDSTTQTVSLQPGASCTLSVTATPATQGVTSGAIGIQDSAPGSPQQIAVSVTGTVPPPSCRISSVTPTQVTFTTQDTNSGLSNIILLDSTNANVTFPPFASGTTSPVNVTASQVDSSQPSKVDIKVANVAGAATSCGATFGGPTGWIGIGGSFTGKIVTVSNADGRLQNFVRGADNALWTIAQNSPDNGWASWQSLDGVITSNPSVAVNVDGRLEAFAIGADGALWHIWQTSAGAPWSNWESLGGYITSDPVAIANQDGRLEVFVLGGDQALWHIWQTSAGGGWSDWASLGGGILSNPTVVRNADGRLEAFVVGGDQALWHIAQTAANSGWGGWSSLGGTVSGDPAPAVNQDGRLEVFVRGADDQLYHIWQTVPGGSWVNYSALGGTLTSNPAVGMNADGRLEAFVRGPDSALWHIAQTAVNSSWGSWASLGGTLANGPTAALNQDGRLEAAVEGGDTMLWYIEQNAPGFWN